MLCTDWLCDIKTSILQCIVGSASPSCFPGKMEIENTFQDNKSPKYEHWATKSATINGFGKSRTSVKARMRALRSKISYKPKIPVAFSSTPETPKTRHRQSKPKETPPSVVVNAINQAENDIQSRSSFKINALKGASASNGDNRLDSGVFFYFHFAW